MRAELLLVVVALSVRSTAMAQDWRPAWVYSDTVGPPVLTVNTPTLSAGSCYELQTTALSSAGDTVMSIRSSASVNAITYAGADDCATPGSTYELRRSCVRFCPTETRTYTLVIRAWTQYNQGTAWVVGQQVSATGTPGTSTCGVPGDPLNAGCWTVLSYSASFGGITVTLPDAGAYAQFETAELPGAQAAPLPSTHVIMFAGDNDDLTRNWNIGANPFSSRNGNAGSQRSSIAGTAQYSGAPPLSPSWNLYTAIAAPVSGSSAGPFRFIRNDYVRTSTTTLAGTDADGDLLGPALESFLKTCDNASTPTYGGIACTSLPNGCGSDPEHGVSVA